jgi:hypothetical protein
LTYRFPVIYFQVNLTENPRAWEPRAAELHLNEHLYQEREGAL